MVLAKAGGGYTKNLLRLPLHAIPDCIKIGCSNIKEEKQHSLSQQSRSRCSGLSASTPLWVSGRPRGLRKDGEVTIPGIQVGLKNLLFSRKRVSREYF